MIWMCVALGFSALYMLLQVFYLYHWRNTIVCPDADDSYNGSGVSIIIVAHNEEQVLSDCLVSILAQQYPPDLFEVIVVDDHSTDRTYQVVQQIDYPSVHLFALKDFPAYIHAPGYKKSGIALGVDKSRFKHIIVTDADCIHPPYWLAKVMMCQDKNQTVFQTAPVLLTPGQTLLEKMQEAEGLTLMLITAAGIRSRIHDIANGANMAFQKKAFLQVGGFDDNYQYASGDDMFLIEKMRQAYPEQIAFVKSLDATVVTAGKKNWAGLLQQRLRWAGKNKGLRNKRINRIWMFVGVYHVVIVLFFLLALAGKAPWGLFAMLLLVKWVMDFLVLHQSALFFKRTRVLRYFIPLQFLYGYYVLRLAWAMVMGQKDDWRREV